MSLAHSIPQIEVLSSSRRFSNIVVSCLLGMVWLPAEMGHKPVRRHWRPPNWAGRTVDSRRSAVQQVWQFTY